MNASVSSVETRVSLWFAILSPLIGVLFGMLAAFVFNH